MRLRYIFGISPTFIFTFTSSHYISKYVGVNRYTFLISSKEGTNSYLNRGTT